MLYNLLYNMQRLAILLMLAASSAFAVPQPYPIAVDSQTRSVPALEMYQAEPFTVRATFRSGGEAEDVSTTTPFMYWATSAVATNYVTSSWVRVNGGTTGVVDFTFSAAAVNTNGDLIYGVGAGSTFRQGALKIRANPFTAGVASPTFTLATNLAGITFINYPWLDSVALYEGDSNHAAVVGNGIVLVVRTNYGGGSISTESDPIFVAASNALLTKVQASSIYSTGTPIYAESDPLFVAASNALLTKAQASVLYATGTPVYAVSGLGTDTYARTTAEWASNRANAAHSIASAAATGTPIYSVSGLATGTPIYSVAGLATGTPIYSVAGLATGTPIYSVDGLATGTPLYVESFTGSVGSLSGYMPSAAVTDAITALSFPLASGQNLSGRVAAVEGAYISGGESSNSFVRTTDTRGSTNAGQIVANGGLRMGLGETYGAGKASARMEFIVSRGAGLITTNTLVSTDYSSTRDLFFLPPDWSGTYAQYRIWRRDNDGAGSLLDADLLDGQDSSYYLNGANITNAPAAWTNQPSLAALSNAVAGAGAAATNQALAIGAGATALVTQASAAGTNFALAVGAGNSNLTLSAWATASNGLTTAQAAQVQASNINAGAWTQIATNTITAPSNSAVRIGLSLGLSGGAMLGQASAIAPQSIEMYGWTASSGVQSGRYTMGWSGGQVYPAWGTSSSTNLFYGPWNFSPSSYTLYSEFNSYRTNAVKLYAVAVTQDQVTVYGALYFTGTNVWIGLGSTNSLRVNGVLNAY